MSESLFRRVVVPVANRKDAAATAAALAPHVTGPGDTVVAVHVLEDADSEPDEAAVEQREQFAEGIFDRVVEGLADADVNVETRIRSGSDVAEVIIDVAHEEGAGAIVFTPRGGSRWLKLLTGDVTTSLVNESDLPVIVLPDRSEDGTR